MTYTSFKLSNIISDKKTYNSDGTIKISCKVKNTGDVAGKEVIQVYVGKKNSKVKRALKELKGFKKISILKGGLEKIEIKIAVDKLAFYDEKISDWNVEKGDYIIYVGNSSDNISKQIPITII
jgi:beta-glucosidase